MDELQQNGEEVSQPQKRQVESKPQQPPQIIESIRQTKTPHEALKAIAKEREKGVAKPEPYPSETPEDYVSIDIDDLEEQILVGKIAFVKYRNRKTQNIETAVGRVQHNNAMQIELFNEHTGDTKTITETVPTIESIMVEPESTEWRTGTKDNMSRLMRGRNNLYGVIKTKSFLVAGNIALDTRYPNRHMVQVTDARGTQHHIDLDYFQGNFLLTEKSEKTSQWQIGIVDEPLNNVDIWKEERQQLIEELIQDGGNVYENQKLYQFLSEHMDYTKNLLLKTYPKKANELIASTVTALGEAYLPLLFDPGIALRSEEFNNFVQKNVGIASNPSLHAVREAFSEYLGTQKVYRGVILREPEMKTSLATGLDSLGYKDRTFFKSLLTEHLDPFYREKPLTSRNLSEEIKKRIGVERIGQPNATLSVTDYPEVAHSFATPRRKDEATEGEIYIYDMDIPRIALITKEGVFSELNYQSIVRIGSKEYDESTDTGVEMFVPFSIKPEWIKDIEKKDTGTDKWEIIER